MAKKKPVVRRFKMTFPSEILGEPIMHKLSHDLNIVPNISRGRITDKNAWLEVEMEGAQKNIDKALVYLAERGIVVEEATV